MKKVAIVCQLVSSLTFPVMGQNILPDTTHLLSPVEINATRFSSHNPGLRIEKVDTLLLKLHPFASLASVLSQNSVALVRSYGTGMLATLSLRGTLPTQTGVFWNGFNLAMPNMGMTDLSLIPSFFFSSVEIQPGGASSVYGSGLIGGGLHLGGEPAFESSFRGQTILGLGSFGNFSAGSRITVGNGKIAWMAAAISSTNPNRFPYRNAAGERFLMEHALGSGEGAISQLEIRLPGNQTIAIGNWYQSAERDIPATLVMAGNDQHQTDRSFRNTLQYSRYQKNRRIQARWAGFTDYLRFTSPKAMIDARYNLNNWMVETELQQGLFRLHRLDFLLSYRLFNADVPYYDGRKKQEVYAAFLSYIMGFKKSDWKIAFNFRKEFSEEYRIPFCPSMNAGGKISKTLSARIAISRNYRTPAMNDRYWQPGGNPDLLPESGWNQEAGIEWSPLFTNFRHKLNLGVTMYNMLIEDLIQWVPAGPGLSSPVNISSVWSRGIETTVRYSRKARLADYSLNMNYSFSPSTWQGNEKYQLIYIPRHRLNLSAGWTRKMFNLILTTSVFGKRYVLADNSESLPMYSLLNLSVSREFLLGTRKLLLILETRNLTNSRYQVVLNYPEPGISCMCNVKFSF